MLWSQNHRNTAAAPDVVRRCPKNGDFHFISEKFIYLLLVQYTAAVLVARFRSAQTVGPNKATTNLEAHILKSNFCGSFGHYSCSTVHHYAVIQYDEELKQRRSFNMRVWDSASLVPVISVQSHGLCPHLYADDTQIYGFCRPAASLELQNNITSCVDDVASWMFGSS